jgi:membrane protease YdiL (CAAX protease family)
MFSVVIFLGLLLSKHIGMGLPILQGVLEGKNQTKELKSIILPSACLGILAGILIILSSVPFNKLIPELQLWEVSASAWKAFLASFYGGIAEEVLLRLFLVSLFVWITFKIKKTKDGHPANFGIWLSIILAAIIFGLGHLPVTSQITALTGIVVIRAIVLNGIGGIIFGWLYWKKGLESAMIAHFSTDIVLHIISPLVASFLL